ncbi:hypothetical protein DXG01_004329 [Tephrocybe rancida]|nr:hypothetical protein DXG01_004329 [Tephrocybe rancida]
MPHTNIVFFDIPTTRGTPVSPYTWRVRTHWIETVDIEAESRSLKIPPTGVKSTGEPLFTLPAIIDYTSSDTEPIAISDSFRILRYLEGQYPSPSQPLFPAHLEPRWTSFNEFMDTHLIFLGGSLFLHDLARSKVSRDLVLFKSRMEVLFGGKWEDLEMKGTVRASTWEKLEANLSSVPELFGTNAGSRFLVEDDLTYPDFVICACLLWLKKIVSHADWARICAWDGGRWVEFIQAFDAWMSVDQYPGM